jgi:hypothetical protein
MTVPAATTRLLRALATALALVGAASRCSSSEGASGDANDAGADTQGNDTGADATVDAPLDGGGDGDGGADGCAPVRVTSYASTVAVPLGCDAANPAVILDQAVPSTGRALGRATFSVHHKGTNAVTHFWNVQVRIGSPIAAFGLGDDVCPGTTSARANLGFGTLSASSAHAVVVGYSGAAPCTPGTLEVLAGAALDVWVEDDAPGCAGKDIAFGSWYAANGFSAVYDWTTAYTPLTGVTAALTTEAANEKLRVLGVVEGSPSLDPNTTCGSEVATIDMQTALDGTTMTYAREVVPASQGMGHRVIFTSGDSQEIRYVAPGVHTASLLVASDFDTSAHPVTTGGCCGDGEVALVRLR